MLLALAKKLRAEALKSAEPSSLPIGTLTFATLYEQPRYGQIEGIGSVRIDGVGNMVGFSPVSLCVDLDHEGEMTWIQTELVRGGGFEPYTSSTATRSRSASPEATVRPRASHHRAKKPAAANA